ncbi:MAG: VWA domain-containing protein, partial [Desulfuromonadales bacterium]|nr:VWA domain-containing protein [Desulfuromonadales bacterium]
MSEFHFLRPDWFWLLAPALLLLLLLWRRQLRSRSWQSVCDPQLLPHLLIGRSQRRSNWPLHMLLLALLLATTALAGPVWERQQVPLFRQDSALVLLLDLSLSMHAGDLKPDRLTRAKMKLHDILQQRREGQSALVVFAGDAFTVTPLTDDANTIIALLDSLEPGLMPVA